MTGRTYQEEASRRDREDAGRGRTARQEHEHDETRAEGETRRAGREKDGERRVVDDSVPAPGGLTSPGEGMDEAPVEPDQSKDYT